MSLTIVVDAVAPNGWAHAPQTLKPIFNHGDCNGRYYFQAQSTEAGGHP
jgi:hypothetical protein